MNQRDQPVLIYSAGTQVVAQKDVMAANDRIAHPAGAVGVIVRSPIDRTHAYRVKFSNGFDDGAQTVEKEGIYDGLEIDLVAHDAAKFFNWMLRRNGYVLEQIFSPLVVFATPEVYELKAIAANCITRHHSHHYLGFAATQWKLFSTPTPHSRIGVTITGAKPPLKG